MSTTIPTMATAAPQQTRVKPPCSHRTSIKEGTRIPMRLPIPTYLQELTIYAHLVRLDTHRIIQTHIPAVNLRHSPPRGPHLMSLLLWLEWDMPHAPNNRQPPITMEPTRCPPGHLAQPIQASQDPLEVVRDHHDRLQHLTAVLRSLPEPTMYPQLDLPPHLQHQVQQCWNEPEPRRVPLNIQPWCLQQVQQL